MSQPAQPLVSASASGAATALDERFVSVELVESEQPVTAELVSGDDVLDALPARRHGLVAALVSLASGVEWLFGVVSLVAALAILATLPILQVLSLGYLLEVSGRIARERRLAAGFVGVRKAARVGGLVLGAWLVVLPVRFIASMVGSARLIAPGSDIDRRWTILLWVATALLIAHLIGACLRGGRLRHFLWPRPIRSWRALRARGTYAQARDAVWDFTVGLRLPYYFWLGLRGLVGGLVWLVVPVTLLAAGAQAPVVGFAGALLLGFVAVYLPFAQARFAAENRMRAMFELRAVRRMFARAPIAFWLAVVSTLLFALPLYLLKIEIVPREAAWLPAVLFVVFCWPARMLAGWASARALRRENPRHWLWRTAARLAMVPAVAAYVGIVFLTQFTSWYGIASLYEQHAFLVPVPFLGL